MTTSGPKETTVKPEIPTLDLSEAQEVPRKKTLTEKVKSLKETVKRAVTPRSRSASMNEEELAAAAKKVKVTESDQKGQADQADQADEAEKPTYAQMAKKATMAVKKTLGIEATKKEEEEKAQVEEASRLANEKKEAKEKKGAVAGGVAGGLVAVGLLILGVVLSKAGAKPAKPVVEKKKSFGFGK